MMNDPKTKINTESYIFNKTTIIPGGLFCIKL